MATDSNHAKPAPATADGGELARELAHFSPLDTIHPENLRELAAKARRITVEAGQDLFRRHPGADKRLFLAEGTLELSGDDGPAHSLSANTPAAINALDVLVPSAHAARAATAATVIAVDRDLLDLMLTWNQTGQYVVEELGQGEAMTEQPDWMGRLLENGCFRRIPAANIQAAFQRMTPVRFEADTEVIRQGDPGDSFYVIRDGRCRVTRSSPTRPQGIALAELGAGDAFGEEALISDSERNATVSMLETGTLMRLSRTDFEALLTEPAIDSIDFADAVGLTAQGAVWIDVRLPNEFAVRHIRGAHNLPLFMLRMKAHRLDPDRICLVYCDTGRRSAAAAFLLGQRGLDARVLADGLANVPAEAFASES